MLLALFSGIFSGYSQNQARKQIYDAYVTNQMSVWELVMADYEKKAVNLEMYYNLAEFHYGFIGYCLSAKLYGKAGHYLDLGEANLDRILKIEPNSSKVYAMKGAFVGFRIVLSKFKAVYLGQKSLNYIDKAVSLDPENPTAWIEKGNADYYRPSYLGGSKERAVGHYEKALFLFEKDAGKLKQNWIYLSLLATLGNAYRDIGNYQKAKQLYDKLLKIEPEFQWVKNELYPKLLKKMNNE
jgi:tetratricopeptide (TPR) repeat protein